MGANWYDVDEGVILLETQINISESLGVWDAIALLTFGNIYPDVFVYIGENEESLRFEWQIGQWHCDPSDTTDGFYGNTPVLCRWLAKNEGLITGIYLANL